MTSDEKSKKEQHDLTVDMLLRKKLYIPGLQILASSALAILFLLAIVLRVSLYHVVSSDYTFFLSQWYDFIQTHGGFAALKYNFSNYNPPYLYLLALTTYLPIPKLVAIKTLSVVFDGFLGLFTYLLLGLKFRRSYAAIIGVLVVLFAPTIVINSAAWGQSDAIYTAFCLGSLYFLLKERPGWASVFFGLAISFKLQAIFFLPVLLIVLLRRKWDEISPSHPRSLPAYAGSGFPCRSRCMEFAYDLCRTDYQRRCRRARAVQWQGAWTILWRKAGTIQWHWKRAI